jgi:hypothetical protein
MIAKGTAHRHGAVLARYLVTGKKRERAELWELRGFACTGIVPAFRSVHVMAAATKCLAPFFHVSVRNPDGDNLDRSQWEVVVNCVERMLGLTDQPRAVAFHIAADTGHAHMHIAWSRINEETLTAVPLPFFKQRLKAVCRELEERFALTPVPNERRSPIGFAPTRSEEEQARRLGVDVHATRESIRNCFVRSDCGRSFRDALAHEGLVLTRGDRRDFLVVDGAGGIHALGKRIVGMSAAHIRDRLDDLSDEALPTLEQARGAIAAINIVLPDKDALPVCRKDKRSKKSPRDQETPRDCTTKKKGRAAGKEWPLHEVRADMEDVQPVVPLDNLPAKALAPRGSFESEHAPIDQLCEPTEPQGNVACSNELVRTSISPQAQTGSAFSPVASAAPEPVTEGLLRIEQHPPAQKPHGPAVRLMDRFRALVKQITARNPEPRPTSRKRRRDEMGGSFRKAALGVLRCVARIPPLHFLDPTWEAFTWLHLWEYNSGSSADFHQRHAASPPPENHSIRL